MPRRGGETPGRPYGRRGLDTRKKILKVSLRLFSDLGFHQTTVRRIGRECGITDAAIYYHFRSKRHLMEALYREGGFAEALDKMANPAPTVSLEEYLINAANVTADLFVRNADLLRVTLMGVMMGDWAAGALYWEYRENWRRSFERLLEEYAEREGLKVLSTNASSALVSTVVGAFFDKVATAPRGRLRRTAGKEFRVRLVSIARDVAAIWEFRYAGPLASPSVQEADSGVNEVQPKADEEDGAEGDHCPVKGLAH